MHNTKKVVTEPSLVLSTRRQAVVARARAVLVSYCGKPPRALVDAIAAVIAIHEGTETETDQIEALLDQWARLH